MKLLKHVIVIASGETERRARPRLLSHLRGEGISIEAVRIPPGNRQLNLRTVESLVKSACCVEEKRINEIRQLRGVLSVGTKRQV